jgi:hypothetical protein
MSNACAEPLNVECLCWPQAALLLSGPLVLDTRLFQGKSTSVDEDFAKDLGCVTCACNLDPDAHACLIS